MIGLRGGPEGTNCTRSSQHCPAPVHLDLNGRVGTVAEVDVVAGRCTVDLAALVRSCAVKAPSRVNENARASTLSPRDRAEAERFARDQPPPDGWTLDGARWIEWDGTVSDVHPALEEGVRRWVEARNAEAREANARADETEAARRPVAVVKDERYERRRYFRINE